MLLGPAGTCVILQTVNWSQIGFSRIIQSFFLILEDLFQSTGIRFPIFFLVILEKNCQDLYGFSLRFSRIFQDSSGFLKNCWNLSSISDDQIDANRIFPNFPRIIQGSFFLFLSRIVPDY